MKKSIVYPVLAVLTLSTPLAFADDAHHYTFDPDHAMLAFPVASLRETMAQLRTVTGAGLSQSDCSVIGGQCFDRQGPIAELRKLLSRP